MLGLRSLPGPRCIDRRDRRAASRRADRERDPSGVAQGLASDVGALARSIMTTDTHEKIATVEMGGASFTGVAKGAAMLAPNMATMLAFIATDADVETAAFQDALGRAVEHSFNRISVDACESTNDSVFVLCVRPRPPLVRQRSRAALVNDLSGPRPPDGARCRGWFEGGSDRGRGRERRRACRGSGPRRRCLGLVACGRSRCRPELGPHRLGARTAGPSSRPRAARDRDRLRGRIRARSTRRAPSTRPRR